jgi:AraC family transcriptional regulator, regulatory protein of adaptative response / methylated-DNA-[protein]-cysteine methyltransferase
MNDFGRVAEIIRYLEEHRGEQPALAKIAEVTALSESHLHRLFHRWAGVTPKDFLQCLTAEHAKDRLRDSASVLEAALEAGLSGPGRLHDLLVTIEGASPGEFKTGGRGVRIEWGFAESPFGLCSVGWNMRGICHVAFHDGIASATVPTELRRDWPNADYHRNDRDARKQAHAIFTGERSSGAPLKAYVRATAFQVKVWRALLRIPAGGVASYQKIAAAICDRNAARAVGTACGANPIAYLIPCHRVIRETGVIQGYRWGAARKQAMLGWEFAKRGAAREKDQEQEQDHEREEEVVSSS